MKAKYTAVCVWIAACTGTDEAPSATSINTMNHEQTDGPSDAVVAPHYPNLPSDNATDASVPDADPLDAKEREAAITSMTAHFSTPDDGGMVGPFEIRVAAFEWQDPSVIFSRDLPYGSLPTHLNLAGVATYESFLIELTAAPPRPITLNNVVGLTLYKQRITAKVWYALGAFTGLQTLVLDHCTFDELPSSAAIDPSWPGLRKAQLKNTKLTDRHLRSLERSEFLEELHLSWNTALTADALIEIAPKWSHLAVLRLEEMDLTDHHLRAFRKNRELREVRLSGNRFLGTAGFQIVLREWTAIEVLHLAYMDLRDEHLAYVEACSSLKELWLSGNRIAIVDPSPDPLPKLRETNVISPDGFSRLMHSLLTLRVLRLRSMRLTASELSALRENTTLEDVDLSGNDQMLNAMVVTVANDTFSRWTMLQSLALENVNLRPSGLDIFKNKKHLKHLKFLSIKSNPAITASAALSDIRAAHPSITLRSDVHEEPWKPLKPSRWRSNVDQTHKL